MEMKTMAPSLAVVGVLMSGSPAFAEAASARACAEAAISSQNFYHYGSIPDQDPHHRRATVALHLAMNGFVATTLRDTGRNCAGDFNVNTTLRLARGDISSTIPTSTRLDFTNSAIVRGAKPTSDILTTIPYKRECARAERAGYSSLKVSATETVTYIDGRRSAQSTTTHAIGSVSCRNTKPRTQVNYFLTTS